MDPFSVRDTTFKLTDRASMDRESLPPLPKDPRPKRFKILLVYPNYMMVNLLPTNIGILTACLRQNGFEVDLFDTTFYRTAEKSIDEKRVEILQLRKFSFEEFGVTFKPGHYLDDFVKKVEAFRPDLIAVTTVEDTWPQALDMLDAVSHLPIPTIVGGVYPTLAPEVVIRPAAVDMLCVAEGEHALIELCYRMFQRQDHTDVRNLWVKKDGGIVKNPIRPPIAMDDVPHSDWTLFEKERFFRPMQGAMFRMVPVETDRGCPYTCRFCEAPSLVDLYRRDTGQHYFRRKSPQRIREELELYIKQYGADYIYFNAETFLAMSQEEFKAFIELYRDYKLPFWMQTRIETFTMQNVEALAGVNCNRISVGLEHGNEEFRRKIIGKGFSNQRIIDVFHNILDPSPIPITINNIVGFPDETRELTFDTIELNRRLHADSINAFYYMPYRGTSMRQDCVTKGYVTEDTRTGTLHGGAVLDMPGYTKEAVMGMVRTFSLYVKFPKEEWPIIAHAERLDEEGNRVFAELAKRYEERFFDHDLKSSKKACFSSKVFTESITPV